MSVETVFVFGNMVSCLGDSFSINKGMKFSTVDKDYDDKPNEDCADQYKGGWWYGGPSGCLQCNPNGRYALNEESHEVIVWKSFTGLQCLQFIEMKLRPT